MSFHIDDTELYLFGEGTNAYTYKMLGCHFVHGEYDAVRFAVWAPHACSVSVVGTFNDWNIDANPMKKLADTGVWEVHIDNARTGDLYKYAITTRSGKTIYKADPYAFRSQHRPDTASVVWQVEDYDWTDEEYLNRRKTMNPYKEPMSIYEVHIGSWRKGEGLHELSSSLVDYVADMGYTHIELMPVCEYPLDDSWGYQVTGYYSVSTRYGTPWDLKHFINACHMKGIGVIIDWVPAHFPRDDHGLCSFDGEALYEDADTRRSDQPQWGTRLFDYSKPQVKSFLISNAVFLFNEFHVDGLRVDAVSCMLYLDYGKEAGQWVPNIYGGKENIDAIEFLRALAKTVGRECESCLLIAEESTAFPLVTKPPEVGGLGFNFKWNMGYMNDTLSYMSLDPYFRRFNHDKLTFSMMYAFSENYILPFSHDEVVHGKRSLIGRMPGEYDAMFSQLRLLYMYQFAHPGKKLMFMGSEFAQFIEWNFRQSIDFCLLEYPRHNQMREFVKKLNMIYREYSPFYACDTGWEGFTWRVVDDRDMSVVAFSRKDGHHEMICVFNFTPVTHERYPIPVDRPMKVMELLNSNDVNYGGDGTHQNGIIISHTGENGSNNVIDVTLPGLSAIYFKVI